MLFIIQQIGKPLSRRIGSYAAGFLSSVGFSAEVTQQLEIALVAFLAVLVDLALSYADRKHR